MKMIRRFALASGLLIVSAAFAPSAFAQTTATDTVNVSATITNSCTIVAAPVNFGSVSTIGSGLTAQGSVTPTCTYYNTTPPITITLDSGANGTAGTATTAPLRNLKSGTNTLGYQLYTDAANNIPWVDGNYTNPVTTAGANQVGVATSPAAINIYGKIPSQTIPGGGTYTDAVQATISF